MADDNGLAVQVADMASDIVASATESHYAHRQYIDPSAGIYDVDCSSFVTHILGLVAERHLADIPKTSVVDRQLAADYQQFFAGLAPDAVRGWRAVPLLADARRGDLVAWSLGQAPPDDTGHVFVVAEIPDPDEDGSLMVSVYDASDKPHFEDSRGPPPKEFATGVGSGRIRFLVRDGQATGFQFHARGPVTDAPISIGRIVPLSDG